jgi:hypothetical protein
VSLDINIGAPRRAGMGADVAPARAAAAPPRLSHSSRRSSCRAETLARRSPFVLLALSLLGIAACSEQKASPNPDPTPREPGATEFSTVEQGNSGNRNFGGPTAADSGKTAGAANAGAGGTSGAAPQSPATPPPSGRVADVQEADIYKMDGTRLFYLNTYRGLTVYDVADPQKPALLSRLPVYGYPIEMFVEGNTIYALLRDALYLTQVDGKVQFQKHNVSQLVTIDVSDIANPKVLKTVDIIGQLHEGVSRKVDDTIYVVSEQFGSYYWTWYTPDLTRPSDQAWVYSFDVSNAQNPRLAGMLKIFEGGGYNNYDKTSGSSSSRSFGGVAISATSNALMVVENWYGYSYSGGTYCGSQNTQEAVVSLIDISDPTGNIRLHSHFTTSGVLSDQFKMTYVPDPASGTGTFYGIFAQQTWTGCTGGSTVNALESWDVTDGAHPAKLAALTFGKDNETVAATSFDLKRNVAYAITSRRIDPLYALDISDRKNPRVASAIDGLSGSVSVFRQVNDGKFLLGVGTDQSDACTGFQDNGGTWANTKMALSIIDVQDLKNIRLVQRKCIAIKNAGWTWSQITWNQDQAHKMLGMFADGNLNVLTVPVSYDTKEDLPNAWGWWYHWQTAVGLLSWDLSLYDPAKQPADQNVIQTYGTFIHPQGEVERSILFKHPLTGNRTMINLSDTHLSVANIQDLNAPVLQSVVDVAPEISGLVSFGDTVVERVEVGNGTWYNWDYEMSEFRVKKAGGSLDDRTPIATFRIGQVSSVHRFKNNLVVMRRVWDRMSTAPATTEAVVVDLSNPAQPVAASRIAVPFDPYYFYGYYCGIDYFYRGYWFGGYQSLLTTDAGLVQLRTTNSSSTSGTTANGTYYYVSSYDQVLDFLDLRNPAAPKLSELKAGTNTYDSRVNAGYGWWDTLGLVADPAAPSGFFITRRTAVEPVKMPNGDVFTRYRYYAKRFDTGDDGLVAGDETNLPGPLTQTWKDAGGTRFYLTQNNVYRTLQYPDHTEWHADTDVSLLRALSSSKAELLDHHLFTDLSLSSMIVDGSRLYVVGQQQYYWWSYDAYRAANPPSWESTSDRLLIFDTGAGTLASLYNEPTRTYGVQLMGTHAGKLFINLPGDGVLMADVSNPAAPQGQRFMRTLGYSSALEFADQDAYQASGHFGIFDMNLGAPGKLPAETTQVGP